MTYVKLIFVVIIGLILGGATNMALISLSPHIVPPPPGANMMTAEGITAALPQLRPVHFLMPFLAHAIGTMVGAMIAALLTTRHKLPAVLIVGVVFLIGGIAAARMIPAPTWFIAADLILAYIPFAYLGYLLALAIKRRRTAHA